MTEPFLSIVIPAYNEEARIGRTLEQVVSFLASQPYSSEIVVADDGSTDGTAAIVRPFSERQSPPLLRVIHLPHGGKGWAVKHGMLEATGQYRFLCDADLSMPIGEVSKFLPPACSGYDVAVGSREAPGARRIGEPPRRHMMGRVFNIIVRVLAVHGLRDTQCGFKCFERAAAQTLFPLQRLNGFGFDVEVLFLAQRRGLRVVEVPIEWHYQARSKVRPWRDASRMLMDIFRVRWAHLRGRYRQPPGA